MLADQGVDQLTESPLLVPTTMPTIWEPPNKHALPTPNEARLVKESIELLEIQLQSAMVALMRAQLAVTTLQRHIEERRAWIAPIRRLPHDILSNIFLDVCEEGEWWTPLNLAEVCQVWRGSMLATPKAWSHLSLRDTPSPEVHSLYFTRSAPYPLHMSLPEELDVLPLLDITERIQCVNLTAPQFLKLDEYPFPRLERVHIFGKDDIDEFINNGNMLDSDRFPNLRSVGANNLLDTISWRRTPPFANFVPLQELKVTPSHPWMWSKIIKHICQTLTSLCVDLSYTRQYSRAQKPGTVCFPQLYHLEIYDSSFELPIPWRIDARTPSLQTYKEDVVHRGHTGPIHKDTSTVIAFQFSGAMELSLFPSVRQMEPPPWYLVNIVAKLCDDPTACPELELIVDTEFVMDEELEQMTATRNARTGKTIRFEPRMQHDVFAYPGIKSHVGLLNSSMTRALTSYSSAAEACHVILEYSAGVRE
jgi:hypothetical protein